MSDNVPVTFTYQGKQIKGVFTKVSGMGSTSMFHLYVDKMYWGMLDYVNGRPAFRSERGMESAIEAGWRFSSNSAPELSEQSRDFEALLISHYE